ncbi:RNA polymerase sigma factor SigJ [Microbacterium sp. 179-I 3D3 NHS]|uniref:RNA polymerase sigma factor SigJ n=1 Tax=unclassified Microbacterium TaxID=2609290 RepID=UPI0039A0310A
MEQIDAIEAERGALLSVAYRLLGTVADAEDAVQETFVRWFRLAPGERAAIRNPAAWLTRVAGRVCLDMLGSARARRERYVGPWLPEPVPLASVPAGSAEIDPLDRVARDESVSMALLVILDALTPAERVAFVLHDVFGVPFAEIAETMGRSVEAVRQLASHARRRVQRRRTSLASREQHDAVVRAFVEASASGDLDRLVSVLGPEVVLRSDGGGKVSAALRPVRGADRVARFLLGVPRLTPGIESVLAETADGIALRAMRDGRTDAIISFVVGQEGIEEVLIVRNPDKLTQW